MQPVEDFWPPNRAYVRNHRHARYNSWRDSAHPKG